ncbi:hypothetical protein BCV69DRAFT_282334 [Microstroma glucosiphilum]|uniref:Uncharacterized protein n=1 Tax=Pseudomicrostroma glucosiphilum TaxID=1684307 RepID=A0A316UES4_9BASI|nr:hypothetical protein BCV69DRAFT_282334 [Pseudomicrostroma glucosiphilum]PWN21615.1 hypothetical protein BCV69DRAFT_282334 [Pseudomicrostroma glucosiphilum]
MDETETQAQAASTSASHHQHRPSIYSQLLQLRRTFGELRDVARPETLHLLDHRTVQALAPAPGLSSSTPFGTASLSRSDFADKVEGVRQAAHAWRKKAVDLRNANLVDPSSSYTFDRYISLNKEKAQNVAQLESNLQPLWEFEKRLGGGRIGEDALYGASTRPLPAVLHAGALASSESTSVIGLKRKRQAASPSTSPAPSRSRGEAVKVLGCLAAALEELARALGLETFAEAFADSTAADDPKETSSLHTHTLTQGGKLIVLDVELGLEASIGNSEATFQPTTRVKLSFTNRTNVSYTSPLKEGEEAVYGNTRIAELLRRDVEMLARLLFGLAIDGEEVVGTMETSLEEASLLLARSHFNRYRTNLLRLLRLDRLSSVKTSEQGDQQGPAAILPCDTFAALHQVAKSLEDASSSECRGNVSLSEEPRDAARVGHGMPLLHTGLVGFCIVYDIKGGSSASMTHLAERRGLVPIDGQPCDSELFLLDVAIESQSLSLSAGTTDLGNSFVPKALFASIPEVGSDIGFVAKLSPSVLLPRRLVTRVANIVGLPTSETSSLHSTDPVAQGENRSSDYGSILGLGSSRKSKKIAGVRVRYQSKRTKSTAEDNALLVSSIPFQTLQQLYLVIEVLQEASAVQRLMQGLIPTVDAPEKDSARLGSISRSLTVERAAATVFDVNLTDVTTARSNATASASEVPRFAVCLSARISDPGTGRFFGLSCYIHRDAGCKDGYGVSGGLTDTLALMGGAAPRADGAGAGQRGRIDFPKDLKSAVGAALAQEADLRRAAELLLQWAWETIDGPEEGKSAEDAQQATAAGLGDESSNKPSTKPASSMMEVDTDDQDGRAAISAASTGLNTPVTQSADGDVPVPVPAPPAQLRRHSSRSSPLSPRTSPKSTRHAEAAALGPASVNANANANIDAQDGTTASRSTDGFAGTLSPPGGEAASTGATATATATATGSSSISSRLSPISISTTMAPAPATSPISASASGLSSASGPASATRTTRRRSSRGPSTPSPTRGVSIGTSHHQTRRRSSQQRASGSGSGSASASEVGGGRGRTHSGETDVATLGNSSASASASGSGSGAGSGSARMTRRASALANAGEIEDVGSEGVVQGEGEE